MTTIEDVIVERMTEIYLNGIDLGETECKVCRGEGEIEVSSKDAYGNVFITFHTCMSCKGSGLK